jgi:hypothetical protein
MGIRGVYVHWDGYPEGRLPVLRALIERDGVSRVVMTIMGQPSGWSSLSPDTFEPQAPGHNGEERFTTVPGYGVQYKPHPIQGNEHYWTPADAPGDYGDEFIYIIDPEGNVRWAATDGDTFAALQWNHVSITA